MSGRKVNLEIRIHKQERRSVRELERINTSTDPRRFKIGCELRDPLSL